jgi:hypothetical protein
MGTSGAYTGAGGKPGRDIAAGMAVWIDGLTGGGDGKVGGGNPPDGQASADGLPPAGRPPVELPPQLVRGLLSLLRPRTASGGGTDGPGAGGSGGRRTSSRIGAGSGGSGLRRSAARAARTTARAGSAAYAYATGDRAALQAIGLDFDSLRRLDDPVEVARRLVEAACGPLSNGTIEDYEERYAAATVAEWVLTESDAGNPPTPEEIARYSIATVIAEVFATEMTQRLQAHSESVAEVAESELAAAAQVLASKAELSVAGVTPDELSGAIEAGIEMLRKIYRAGGS